MKFIRYLPLCRQFKMSTSSTVLVAWTSHQSNFSAAFLSTPCFYTLSCFSKHSLVHENPHSAEEWSYLHLLSLIWVFIGWNGTGFSLTATNYCGIFCSCIIRYSIFLDIKSRHAISFAKTPGWRLGLHGRLCECRCANQYSLCPSSVLRQYVSVQMSADSWVFQVLEAVATQNLNWPCVIVIISKLQ